MPDRTPLERLVAAAELCERAAQQFTDCGYMSSEEDSPTHLIGMAAVPHLGPVFRRWQFIVTFDPDMLHRLGGEETLALADAILSLNGGDRD